MNDLIQKLKLLQKQADVLKTSKVEVLLDSIIIEDENNVTVYPSNCPGKGRKQDILFDAEGEAACMFKGKRCPYFIESMFRLQDYTKAIKCKV